MLSASAVQLKASLPCVTSWLTPPALSLLLLLLLLHASCELQLALQNDRDGKQVIFAAVNKYHQLYSSANMTDARKNMRGRTHRIWVRHSGVLLL